MPPNKNQPRPAIHLALWAAAFMMALAPEILPKNDLILSLVVTVQLALIVHVAVILRRMRRDGQE